MRRANAAACLAALRDQQRPLTIAELATATRLARPTVDAVVGDLLQTGPVRPAKPQRGAGAGRPARAYAFTADAGRVAGIDIGSGSVRVRIADLAGDIVGRAETDVPAGIDGNGRLRVVRTTVRQAVRASGAGLADLRAAGLGVPGILDRDGRITQSLAVPDWIGVDPAARLSAAWDCPVLVENDIKLAALAEQRLRAEPAVGPEPESGADRDDDLIFWQIGHRISTALIMNGAILQGRHRLAGELGSLRGMRWTESSRRGRLQWRSGRTAEQVFARARAGDRRAAAEISEFCAEIAPMIATIALTVDPALIVIGGGLSRAGDDLLAPLTEAVHHMLMTDEKPAITTSLLKSSGTLCGALGSTFEVHSAQILGVPRVPTRWHRWPGTFDGPPSKGVGPDDAVADDAISDVLLSDVRSHAPAVPAAQAAPAVPARSTRRMSR
ncbi:ROK family protein [Actinopolymorpha rutila]|uniref:Putative NBD/HSP70 family sugar kinase n=1 Tax=Actinopolymorpha rutila TaxID=446787 RepID=A0A852ZMZ8_9ACTN|nr:putative NBD/HSP70 family sugar kinase [Actinopolymorpha rutila]